MVPMSFKTPCNLAIAVSIGSLGAHSGIGVPYEGSVSGWKSFDKDSVPYIFFNQYCTFEKAESTVSLLFMYSGSVASLKFELILIPVAYLNLLIYR